MNNKQRIDQLQKGVKSLLAKNGYAFSEEDKALLETILVELEEISNSKQDEGPEYFLKIISLLLRYLKFFGIDDVSVLF